MTKKTLLVIEDSPIHREAARLQLGDTYDLTVVEDCEEGLKALGWGDAGHWRGSGQHRFDLVLVDLQLPVTTHCIADQLKSSFEGQVMPLGIFLGLLAAKNGVSTTDVAVFTDSDHHCHPASAIMDAFNDHESCPTPLAVEGSRLWLINNRGWVDVAKEDDLGRVLTDEEKSPAYDFGYGYPVRLKPGFAWRKRWDLLVSHLTAHNASPVG